MKKVLSIILSILMVFSAFSVMPVSAFAADNSYLTFTGEEAFTLTGTNLSYDGTLQYSTDANTWNTWDKSEISSATTAPYVLYLRGTENTYVKGTSLGGLALSQPAACSGNIMTLLDCNNPSDSFTAEYAFNYLFCKCAKLTSAPALPATTLAKSCYNNMFSGCTGLTEAPVLPATTLANYCYSGMFGKCTGLTEAPALPATTLANSCYTYMFRGCTGLTEAPVLPATTLANSCYNNMFTDCKGLTEAPALPATTLADDCYYYMFNGCTGIRISDEAGTFDGILYSIEYRIPSEGDGTTATDALSNMFANTGGKFKGTPEINTTYYVPDYVHSWVGVEPTWTWATDFSSAKATFTCKKCSYEQEVDATVERQADGKTYIAKVTFNETEYTDTRIKDAPSDAMSITVENGVDVNFYIDTAYHGAEGGEIYYSYIADPTEPNADYDGKVVSVDSLPIVDGLRKLTLKVAPAQLGAMFYMELYDADGRTVASYTDTAAEYCERLIADDDYERYHAVAQALLDYAQLAKEYFDYSDGTELAYDYDHYKDEVTDNFSNRVHVSLAGSIEISSVTFMALLNPEFRFYLKDVTESQAAALDVSIDGGLDAKIVKTEKGICVSVTGLKANEFEKVFTVTVGDTNIEYNGYAYLYTLFYSPYSNDGSLKYLGYGVYRYVTAVEALVG